MNKMKVECEMEGRNQYGYPVWAEDEPHWAGRLLWRVLLALVLALGLSLIPDTDRPRAQTADSAAADLQEADAAWQAAYGGMSEADRMAGVVLEPEGE